MLDVLEQSLATLFGDDLAQQLTEQLESDGLITRRYSLEQVNEGYEDLLAGKNIRGVIVHEHG